MKDGEKPIGIFDSGIGGLTVLKEIIREIPDEDTIYLGDTARVPYGIRSAETVIRYAFENTRFLFSKDIKLLVVACNTASSVSLDAIVQHTSIPVIGVIEPGAKAAVETTQKGKVGVIGTQATQAALREGHCRFCAELGAVPGIVGNGAFRRKACCVTPILGTLNFEGDDLYLVNVDIATVPSVGVGYVMVVVVGREVAG